MNRLKISNLSKAYGKKQVINNINLDLGSGIFGLLGPNGAGKTTLMKCIVNLINYDGAIYLGETKLSDAENCIGYLPQKFSLFNQLTVREALEYIAILKRVNIKEDIDKVLDEVNLTDESNKKIRNLSGGMLRRLGIAQALLGNPKVLIIDEPTVGLDPKERMRFRNLLSNLKKDIIVIVSSHIVEDLVNIADSIAIMKNGTIVEQGKIENLLQNLEKKVGTMQIEKDKLKLFKDNFNITSINYNDDVIDIRLVGDKLPEHVEYVHPTLEDMYFYCNGDLNEN